jgi:hypothetical protein
MLFPSGLEFYNPRYIAIRATFEVIMKSILYKKKPDTRPPWKTTAFQNTI